MKPIEICWMAIAGIYVQCRFLVLLLVLAANIPGTALATEHAWLQLIGPSNMVAAWQGDCSEWTMAAGAAMDEEQPTNLVAKRGVGVFVNLLQEKSELSNLTSKKLFGDVEVHVEFMLPKGSNAGVKLQGLYEIQLRDTYGKENPAANDCGGIYPRAEERPRYHLIDKGFPPRTNAARPPGEWQTLDIWFHAPKFDAEGNKNANARFEKVVLNGQIIHEKVELKWPTGHAWREKPEVAEGPLFLQGDHGSIAYRNVKVRPLHDIGK